MNRPAYAIAAASVFLAGGLLIGYSVRERREQDRATASRLFAALDTRPEISDSETQALKELVHATTGARTAFVRAALVDAKTVARLNAHQHALAVALSQVDRREARALFDDELTHCIKKSSDAAVLSACFALIERWSIFDTIGQSELDTMTETLVNRIALSAKQQDGHTQRLLAGSIGALAPRISEATASDLATQLRKQIEGSLDRERFATSLTALGHLAPRAHPDVKVSLARFLVERVTFENDAVALPLWSDALGALSDVPESAADELASKLTMRVASETRPSAVVPLITALNVFAQHVSPRQAEESVRALTAKLQDGDVAVFSTAGTGITLLSSKVRPETIQKARSLLMDRLRNERDAKSAAMVAFLLGDLNGGVATGGFDEAIKIVIERMAGQNGSYELSLFDSALVNLVRAGVSPATATTSARSLIGRMEHEQQIPNLLRIAVGVETLARFVPKENQSAFVEPLIERMRESSGASVLRALAFNIGDFEAGATEAQILRAAQKVGERIKKENDPSSLRALVAGLLNLGGRVPEELFGDASDKAEALLKTETNFKAREDLEATIEALEERTGGETKKNPELEQKLDETVARQLFDPATEPHVWERLAISSAPAKEAAKTEDDDTEESADFHTLLIADDDGEADTEEQAYPIDFNRLSDALDRYRPQHPRESWMTPVSMTGIALMIVGVLLAIRRITTMPSASARR